MESADDTLDLDLFLAAGTREALALQHWPDFLDWVRNHVEDFAPDNSPLRGDIQFRAAFAYALARSFWNAMPLPRKAFRPEPVAEPGRNDACPCGSGRKYKQCCQHSPRLGVFTPALLWPSVLEALDRKTRVTALDSRQVPCEALLEFVDLAFDAGRLNEVIEILEPRFADTPAENDELAGAFLNLLCNAFDAKGRNRRRKLALLERLTSLPRRSPLRSEAWQRLACIHMDNDRREDAWLAFRNAQRDDPENPGIGMLEVQLLIAEGRGSEARDRARFYAAALRRNGRGGDPELLALFEELARDPGHAMSEIVLGHGATGGRQLADLIEGICARPLPLYRIAVEVGEASGSLREQLTAQLRQIGVADSEIGVTVQKLEREIGSMACEEADPEAAQQPEGEWHALTAPEPLGQLEEAWRQVFSLGKPFSVAPLPMDEADIWDEEIEAHWSAWLAGHPQAFDSLDILDDLASATMLHPESGQFFLYERLAEPLLRRAVAILDHALTQALGTRLNWTVAANRPALRSLFRLAELEHERGNFEAELLLTEKLLQINPGDNHGVRYELAWMYVERGENEKCAHLAAGYPEDICPELRFNEALALYRLGHARSASDALERADEMSPRVKRFLLARRIAKPKMDAYGVSLNGDDRAWLYRDQSRELWQQTPGALEWVRKVLGG